MLSFICKIKRGGTLHEYKIKSNYKMGGGVYLIINKRYNNKINKDYEITNSNISDFS